MNKNVKNVRGNIIGTVVCFVLFFLLILIVKTVDVAAVGPENTSIGLSGINVAIHEFFGINSNWYLFTQITGLLAIGIFLATAFYGLMQLVRRKSLAKVDRAIYVLGGLYFIIFALYVFFDKVAVNYRPIIEEGAEHVEASFPSSHTMLIIVVMGSFMITQNRYAVKKGKEFYFMMIASALIMVLTVIGRLVCGVHWFTDIIGSVSLSAGLLFLFTLVLDIVDPQKK